jgi:eukaryotic-like serine/threonine-protein kinase
LSIDGPLLLPPDVKIVAVTELSPEVRSRIAAPEQDYTITRARSRMPSSVIDKDSAELLEIFRTPTRIVDAVLAFADKRGIDPESTLEQAYPMLSRLIRGRFLVPADSGAAWAIESELQAGTVVEGFRLIRCVQVMSDNEVFLARDAQGRFAAVKFHREANSDVVRSLEREADILGRITGERAPKVLGVFRLDSGAGLATEWVSGDEVLVAADRFRGRREPRSERQLLALCAQVATAFAAVHHSGFLHGDVHPRNVLVEKSGTVRLIDFGLARRIERLNAQDQRGGIPFYFDPELARALRSEQPLVASRAAEQYSVAALLYQLWTGVHYLDWSLERDELLRQITDDEPISFEARRVPSWPELEAILRRALHKNPSRRFPDLRALAEALSALLPDAEARDHRATINARERTAAARLLDRALERWRLGGEALRNGLPHAPRASINYGAAGVAYALLRIAQRRADPGLLALADLWGQKAYALAASDGAFYNATLEIEPKTAGERSLFHSPAGLHCVRALISAAQGDVNSANAAMRALVEHSRGPNPCLDATSALDAVLGKGSILLGCAELIEAIPDLPQFDLAIVRARGNEIAREVRTFIESGRIESSEQLTILGIAHGWGGLAFVLLRWATATGREPEPALRTKLAELAELAEPDGAGARWPTEVGGSVFWDGWCNGAAGHAMLWALAHRVLGNSDFGDLAERAAIIAWNSELTTGTLCCGQAGIGYALLAVHRVTGSPQWLRRAQACAQRAAGDASPGFLPDALYKGAAGVAVFSEELEAPQSAAMPLFEPRC